MVDEMTEEQEEQGGSMLKKLVGVLAIFGTVFAALFWWRRRGSGEDADLETDAE